MFQYEKKLQYPVRIKNANPKLAAWIISQYGGPDGELGASIRYLSQRYAMPYPELKGLLTDIGTEELGHLEMIGAIVHQLTRGLTQEQLREIKKYVINPVEAREAALDKPETLERAHAVPQAVRTLTGFTDLDRQGLEDFLARYGRERLWLATTKGGQLYTQPQYRDGDFILFGRETRGLPRDFIAANSDKTVRIPMSENTRARSFNLANSANIILFEALRQLGFPGLA